MQKYAEEAVREHLSQDLQPLFDKEKVKKLRPPFSNDMTPAEIEEVRTVLSVSPSVIGY